MARGNVPDATLFVDADDVRSFDTDTLAIESVDSLKIAATDAAAVALLAKGLDFRGRPLIDARGRKLGKVVQIRLDENGRVVDYRARRGLLGWLKPRRKIKPAQLRTAGGEMGVLRESEAAPPALTSAADATHAPDDEPEDS